MGEVTPCPATVAVGDRTVRCKRELRNPMRPHERHEFKGRGDGYEIIVTWLAILDLPERADTSLTKRRRCGLCRESGHYRRNCPLEGA